MADLKVASVLTEISRNRKREDLDTDEKQIEHDALVQKFFLTVQEREKKLADKAFEGFFPDHSLDPMQAVREAMQEHEIVNLKTAALTAYKLKHYNALRLAGTYDDDIGDLVDLMESYGDMADQENKVFLACLLADPLR